MSLPVWTDQHSCVRQIPDANIRFHTSTHTAALMGTSRLPKMALSGVARRWQLHLWAADCFQTQPDGTVVKWQMWGVIISMRRNAAVQHRAVNYTAAGRLRGWAGQRWWRRVARVAWNTTVKRYFNLNYEVFLFAVSQTRLWSTCGGREKADIWGQ